VDICEAERLGKIGTEGGRASGLINYLRDLMAGIFVFEILGVRIATQ
jgi:hypothetical protein